MSDETPGSEEFQELPEGDSSNGTENPEIVRSGIHRRTAAAPVRKKDLLAREVDPERDDETIASLEGEFPEGGPEEPEGVPAAGKPVKKSTATRRRAESKREESDPYGPTTPANFVRQSVRELKQVVWPTWPELVSHFTAVLVFVLFFIAFIGLLDLLFGWSLLKLLGGAQ